MENKVEAKLVFDFLLNSHLSNFHLGFSFIFCWENPEKKKKKGFPLSF